MDMETVRLYLWRDKKTKGKFMTLNLNFGTKESEQAIEKLILDITKTLESSFPGTTVSHGKTLRAFLETKR